MTAGTLPFPPPTSELASAAPMGAHHGVVVGSERSAATWLHWLLRIGVFLEFVGHGAFGIMGKEAWLPYFDIFGIPESWAWKIMPIVGVIDVAIGIVILFRPMRAVLLYATLWATMTAFLRPLAGQGLWEEVFERGGNFGLPLALLVLVGLGDGTLRSWLARTRPRRLTLEVARTLSWALRIAIALLLMGHGGFGLSHLHDKEWTTYFGVLGVGSGAITGSHLISVIGWFEVGLGIAVLLKPFRALIVFVLAWKLGTEFLRIPAGEPAWEFIERAGDYVLPLSLLLVQARMARSGQRGSHAVGAEATCASAPSLPGAFPTATRSVGSGASSRRQAAEPQGA